MTAMEMLQVSNPTGKKNYAHRLARNLLDSMNTITQIFPRCNARTNNKAELSQK